MIAPMKNKNHFKPNIAPKKKQELNKPPLSPESTKNIMNLSLN